MTVSDSNSDAPKKREPFDAFLARIHLRDPKSKLEDALKAYIAEYRLAACLHIDEAPAVVGIRTRLQILESSALVDRADKELQSYIDGLRFFMQMYRPHPRFLKETNQSSQPARSARG